jgi:hypothetical protein
MPGSVWKMLISNSTFTSITWTSVAATTVAVAKEFERTAVSPRILPDVSMRNFLPESTE